MTSHSTGPDIELSRSAGPNTMIRTRPVNESPIRDYVLSGILTVRDADRLVGVAVDDEILSQDLGLSDIAGPWERILAIRTTDAQPNVRSDCGDLMIAVAGVDLRQWSRPARVDDDVEIRDDVVELDRVAGFL